MSKFRATIFSVFCLLCTALAPAGRGADGTWTNTVDGVWSAATNWSGGALADGAGFTANFNTVDLAGDVTINLDSPRTLGNLVFGDANTNTPAGWLLANNGNAANVLTLAGASAAITVNALGTNETVAISATIAGTAGLNKGGLGTLVLTASNYYSGATTISNGALRVAHAYALGATTGSTTITSSNDAHLELVGGVLVPEPLVIACKGTTAGGWPIVQNLSGSNTLSGLIRGIVGGAEWVFQSDAGRLTVSGDFTNGATTNVRYLKLRGAGDGEWSGNIGLGVGSTNCLWKEGAGTWTVSGRNTYQGSTTIIDGTLQVGNGGTTGVLGAGPVTNNDILAFNRSDNFTLTNAIYGQGMVMQKGSGTLTLAGTNLWSGPAVAARGTLALATNVSLASSNFTVLPGAKLDTTASSTYIMPAGTTYTFGLEAGNAGQIVANGLDISSATVAFSFSDLPTAPVYVIAAHNGPLIGSAFASATVPWGYQLVYDYNGSTQIALVRTGFNFWMTSAFANGNRVAVAQGGEAQDPDADGSKNLTEYAVAGMDPTVRNGSPGALTGLTYTVPKRQPLDPDLAYILEESTDLGKTDAWKTVTSDASYLNTSNLVSFTLRSGLKKDFVRLKIQKADVPPVGAIMPFVTLEAEDGLTDGEVLTNTAYTEPALYASGRQCVKLLGNQSVTFTNPIDANTIVLRFTVPLDSPDGALGLYVNGAYRQTIPVTSAHVEWQLPDLVVDVKTGMIFDETAAFITNGIAKGDLLQLRRLSTNSTDWIILDLVDLEQAPAPLTAPAGSVSVLDYGAKGDGATDCTAAISNCIIAMAAQNKTIWIPPGKYLLGNSITLTTNARIQGAGLWYTTLFMSNTNHSDINSNRSRAFFVKGDHVRVADLKVDSAQNQRGTGFVFNNGGNDLQIRSLWVTHTEGAGWQVGNFSGAVMADCRVHSTYADGINFRQGWCNVLITNNHFRGTGDNSIAIRSIVTNSGSLFYRPMTNVTIVRNTTLCPYTAHGIVVWGGTNHLVAANYMADPVGAGNMQLGSFTLVDTEYPLGDSLVCSNMLVRGFGYDFGHAHPNLDLAPGGTRSGILNVAFVGNRIVDSRDNAIKVFGPGPVRMAITNNVLDRPGTIVLSISGNAAGQVSFQGNVLANPNFQTLIDNPTSTNVFNLVTP